MNQEMLGNMVRFEREKHNLSAKKLADGILSRSGTAAGKRKPCAGFFYIGADH